MLGQMLHDMVDGMEHGDVISLNASALDERLWREAGQHLVGLAYDRAQLVEQRLRRHIGTRDELGVPIPSHRRAPDATDDPLTDVAAQMKHEGADRVLRIRPARPDLLVAQPPQARLDALEPHLELTA